MNQSIESAPAWQRIAKGILLLAVVGLLILAFEHWGDRYVTRIAQYVAGLGQLGVVLFIVINCAGVIVLMPQGVLTVAAGAVFGWKFGTAWASVGMTLGAAVAFSLARHALRARISERWRENGVFVKMQGLSRTHPVHLIIFSRIIPVIPFPVASYLLGVTKVRFVPYVLLTWACMVPETLFLASGGHLLHSGVSGRASMEAAVALGVAAVVFGVVVHRMKRKMMEEE